MTRNNSTYSPVDYDEQQPRAKKALGQHFLTDQHAIRRIAGAIDEGATAIEIGPGPGAITLSLLERLKQLTVIEMDDRFVAHWREYALTHPALQVVHGDVMKELQSTVDAVQPQWIAGNLPYNLSGPLTAQLAGLPLSGGMVLMYQREVAERICAGPGSKVYGGLSVLVRHHYDVKRLLTLPPGAFSPPPKVHSAVVLLTPHHRTPPCTYAQLQRTVRKGFAHRRKVITNNFRGELDADGFAAIDINPGHRPEQLDYAAWARLALRLQEG